MTHTDPKQDRAGFSLDSPKTLDQWLAEVIATVEKPHPPQEVARLQLEHLMSVEKGR